MQPAEGRQVNLKPVVRSADTVDNVDIIHDSYLCSTNEMVQLRGQGSTKIEKDKISKKLKTEIGPEITTLQETKIRKMTNLHSYLSDELQELLLVGSHNMFSSIYESNCMRRVKYTSANILNYFAHNTRGKITEQKLKQNTYGSIVTLMQDMFLSLCLLSAALTKDEKNYQITLSEKSELLRIEKLYIQTVFNRIHTFRDHGTPFGLQRVWLSGLSGIPGLDLNQRGYSSTGSGLLLQVPELMRWLRELRGSTQPCFAHPLPKQTPKLHTLGLSDGSCPTFPVPPEAQQTV